MNCPGENTLLDLIEGGVATGETALRAHLAGCATCRQLLEDARAEQSRTDTADLPPDPDGTRIDRPRRTPSVLSNPAVDPLIGQRIGEYEVLERIGAGGMGVVYRAVQPLIGKPVAIKVIREEANRDAQYMQRMLLEARAVNAIGHRGIVDIFGFGQIAGGRHYVVMEYLQGEPLDLWLKGQPKLSLEDILELLDQALAPLGAAHRAGVIHRDLKPSNFFRVRHDDGHTSLKLLDFGLAKRTVHGKGLTRAGMVVGTPAYMAPEQVAGDPVDARTDLYSLAVVAYRLAGTRPFPEGDPAALMEAHVRMAPRPLRQDRPDLPSALEALLLRMLAKTPAERPASVEEVSQVLAEIRRATPTQEEMPAVILQDQGLHAEERSQSGRSPRARLRVPAAVGMVAVAAVAAALLFGPVEEAVPVEATAPVAAPPPIAAPMPVPIRSPVEAVTTAPEPDALDAREEQVVPSEAPAPHKPRPRVPTLDEERQRLLQRSAAVRAKLTQKDPLSTMFLDKAEAETRRATSRGQLRQAERTIQGVEEKFLSAGR